MKILLSLLMALSIGSASAATISVTQGSGTNMLTKQDGSGNNASSVTLCDATTPTTCAPVSSTLGLAAFLNTTPTLANGNGVVPTQGGTVLSATNGGYSNILQGNAVLSATNGLPASIASGQVASGAFASGSFASGAGTDGWNATEGAKADSPYTGSGSASIVATLKGIYANQGLPYPPGSTPITASATGTTGATTATLAANVSLHTYVCGFSIRANAAAAATANATVTGVVTGTLNYTQWTAPNASGVGTTEQTFLPCIISSAINTGIAVISAAPGTGGVVSVSAWGYQL